MLGKTPSAEFYPIWEAAAIDKMKLFTQQELSNIFYGHALLHKIPHNHLVTALIKLAESTTDLKHLHAIYLSYKSFEKYIWIAQQFQPLRSKFARMIEERKIENATTSNLQRSIYSQLRNLYLNFDVKEEVWFDGIASKVDIYIPAKKLIVEVDGPSHFVKNTREYKPNKFLRDALLSMHSAQEKNAILHIPYFEWEQLKSDGDRQNYLQQQIKRTECLMVQ